MKVTQFQKAITPMKSLRHQFNTILKLIPYDTEINNLNKAKPHYNPFAWHHDRDSSYSKGVKSDFIRIYLSSKSNVSVALSFSYLDGNVPEVIATKKVDNGKENSWTLSAPMTVMICRHALNTLITHMSASEQLSFELFTELFSEIFLKNKLKDTPEVKDAITNYTELLNPEQTELSQCDNELQDINASLVSAKEKYNEIIQESEEQAIVNKIQSQLKEAQDNLSKLRSQKQGSLGIKSLTNSKRVTESKIYELKMKISGKKRDFLKNFSVFMRKAIDPNYNE